MSAKIELFENNIEYISSEKIVSNIKNGEWDSILRGLCNIKDDAIVIEYVYVKYFATKITYNIIINHITNNIDEILSKYPKFNVYVNLKKLTLVDVDKHKDFIQYISIFLRDRYPDKLTKCYVYNAPFVFSQIFNMISYFIDKETQTKVELVQNN